jgi:predicted DCC family thiol-disulfide oxidoreductase YuxK
VIDMPAQSPTIVIIDGECALCGHAAGLLARRLPRSPDVELVALQSARGQQLTAGLAPRDALVVIRGDHVSQGGAAVADALLLLPRWRLLGHALAAVPSRPRERCYDLIARHRHRFARGRSACAVVTAPAQP